MGSALRLVETCKFKIRTQAEAEALSHLAAGMFYEPERVQSGLYELFLNAVEHGCLGIGHELKAKLLASGDWQAELRRREALPENRDKFVEVVIARKPEGTYAVVTDPGGGFDWKRWSALDPACATEAHGHGIVRAKCVSFDSLAFNAAGNQVVAHARDTADLVWR